MQNMTLVNIITECDIYMFVVFLTQTEFRNIRKSKRVFKKAFVVRCLIKQYQYIFVIIPNMVKYGMEQLCTQSSCTQSQKDFQFLFLVNHQQPLQERPFKVSKNSTTLTLAGFGLRSSFSDVIQNRCFSSEPSIVSSSVICFIQSAIPHLAGKNILSLK